MTHLRQSVTIAVSTAAVFLAFQLAALLDRGEESGGMLTGPMILACFLSVPVLVASIACRFRFPKPGLSLWIGGTILAVPLASWRLAPGLWSFISPWPEKAERAPFHLDWLGIALLMCLFISLAAQTWQSRK